MTFKRKFIDYLNNIFDAIDKIERFTKDMTLKAFISDDKT